MDGIDFNDVAEDARRLYQASRKNGGNGSQYPSVRDAFWEDASMEERAPYVSAVLAMYSARRSSEPFIEYGHLPIAEALELHRLKYGGLNISKKWLAYSALCGISAGLVWLVLAYVFIL